MKGIKIVYSGDDPAGSKVASQLRKNHGFAEEKIFEKNNRKLRIWKNEEKQIDLVEVGERLSTETEYLNQFPEVFESELIFFASRHRAESATPCFTAHAPGNFTHENEFGGNPRELARTSAKASACLLRYLKKKENERKLNGFGVFREATHHGPTSLPWPCVFAELGSTEKEWGDEEAAENLAKAILYAAENFEKEEGAVSIGFGGTHYCSKFSSLEFGGGNCFSHIASKHVLDGIEEEPVKQAVEKTVERVEEVLLDWKGTNLQQREKLKKIFSEQGIEWKRI